MARTGIRMTHVPYRGAAPLVQDLLGGRIDVSNSTLPSVLGQIQAGEVKAIALASPQRNPVVADVPTSSIALAVSEIAREKDKVFLASGASTAALRRSPRRWKTRPSGS